MSENTKRAANAANTAPAEEAPATITLEALNQKLQSRYQDLVKMLNNENNMANRYEIKLRIEELSKIAELIFSNNQ